MKDGGSDDYGGGEGDGVTSTTYCFFGGCLASRTAMATYVKMCGSTDQLRTVRCGADAPLAPYYWVIGQLGGVPYYLWQGSYLSVVMKVFRVLFVCFDVYLTCCYKSETYNSTAPRPTPLTGRQWSIHRSDGVVKSERK